MKRARTSTAAGSSFVSHPAPSLELWRLLCAIVMLSVHLQLAAVPPSFVMADDATGPSCHYFTGLGNLRWSERGGDWMDAKGEPYGNAAFDTADIAPGNDRLEASWDVTSLVQGWMTDRYRNDGLLLRVGRRDGSGVADFHSRESADVQARPVLELLYGGGRRVRLAAAADTFLDCSSRRSLGGSATVKVSRLQRGWLRFEIPQVQGELERATLRLTSDKRYGKGLRIGVYRAFPPYARASQPALRGIAARFPQDEGIEEHPAVVFAAGFESPAWSEKWSELHKRGASDTVREDPARKFEPLVGRALRVRIMKGEHLGLNLRYLFAREGVPEPEEIYFRYYLRLGNDWNPTLDGGKLPGIAGTYGKAGWGMRKSDGYNGWSVRGEFMRRPTEATGDMPVSAIGSYAYHAEMKGRSGEYWAWSEGPSGLLEHNLWYAIEQHVKLNTPGRKDGIFEAWVDGQRVHYRDDVVYRHTDELKIEEVWMNVYHGGTREAPRDMTLYIDNVVIASGYIGPMGR